MTKPEGHEFLRKCRRWLVWRSASVDELELVRRTQWGCVILIAQTLVLVGSVARHAYDPDWDRLKLITAIWSPLAIGISGWLLFRVSQARRAIRYQLKIKKS